MSPRDFSKMPKIELHCHLDGALDLALARELLKDRGEEISEDTLSEKLTIYGIEADLASYLARFDLPIRLLQSGYALEEQAYRLATRCANEENIKYLEVRFAPTSHLAEGLTVRDTIESVLAGLRRAEAEVGIFTGTIICAMRHFPVEENLALLKEAREYLGDGVVAFDLAGDEAGYPLKTQAEVFREAARLEMPFTIHAGEAPESKENIALALTLGAKRLGHGIAMRNDPELMKKCANQGIAVELCPTSNLQTGGLRTLSEFPIRTFFSEGIAVSLNTDNRTISGIDLAHEYEIIDREFSLTESELEGLYHDAVRAAFAPDSVKHNLETQWKQK